MSRVANLLAVDWMQRPRIGPEGRERIIKHLVRAANGRRIFVPDTATQFAVPVDIFLQHVESDALSLASSFIQEIATGFAELLGRAEPDALARFCSSEGHQIVADFKDEFARFLVGDAGAGSVDLLAPQPLDQTGGGAALKSVGAGLAKPLRKAAHRDKAGKKIVRLRSPVAGHSKSSRSAKHPPRKGK